MPRGNGRRNGFKVQPSGVYFARAAAVACPACGLVHWTIPERCRRELERRYASSPSDRRRGATGG